MQQRKLFQIRSEMNLLPSNFHSGDVKCETGCGQILTNAHIFNCPVINDNKDNSKYYNYIMNGTLSEKCEGLKLWEINEKKREQYL